MLSMAVRTCSTWWICRRVNMTPIRLIASCATKAASRGASAVGETLEMTAAAQFGSTTISPPKTSMNVASPARMTKEEARLKPRGRKTF